MFWLLWFWSLFRLVVVGLLVRDGAFTTGFSFGRYTLTKAFAECYTRQRALGKQFIGKDLFDECTLSGTRQSLCRVLIRHSAKKSRRDRESHRDGGFAECQGQALGKGRLFAEHR